jgi:Ni,Fe-hydrogenase I cytochrome b subunit
MKKFTAKHRILHWIIAISMLVLLATGFLRMYWMGRKTITAAINKELTTKNLQLPEESIRAIAKSIINPMFEWHVYFAYILVFAYILRIIYMVVKGVKFPNPFNKSTTSKEKFQGTIYFVFYFLLIVEAITGMMLKFDLAGREILEKAEEIHKLAIYWMPAFIIIHFAGIAIAEHTNKKGIVSKMIGGE